MNLFHHHHHQKQSINREELQLEKETLDCLSVILRRPIDRSIVVVVVESIDHRLETRQTTQQVTQIPEVPLPMTTTNQLTSISLAGDFLMQASVSVSAVQASCLTD